MRLYILYIAKIPSVILALIRRDLDCAIFRVNSLLLLRQEAGAGAWQSRTANKSGA